MPASSRNEVAEKHRTQRRVNSPYNQDRRKEKLAASRGWKPSIWKALMFWKHDPSSSDEDSDSIESPGNGQNGQNGTEDVVDVQEDAEESNDALSVMNSSTVSEDQVLRQLISPIPRQVRFQLPSHSPHSTYISSPQHQNQNQNQNQSQSQNQFQRPSAASSSSSSSFRRSSPYVAPLPPSSTLMQMQMGQQYKDPLATVSDYLDNVVLPRGGECTNVEALGLSMLIQSSVKDLASPPPRDATPSVLTRSPFVFPTANSPISLKPTFTTPNTDFAAIFSRPDSSNTTTSFPTTSTNPASSSSTSSSETTTTTRMLTRNPNGNVFFQGGGSAKPRYRSPAFGAPSSRKKITFGDSRMAEGIGSGSGSSSSMAGDGKRRRVGEESYLSVAQPSGPPPPSTSLSSSSALYTVHESSAMDLDSHTQEGVNGSALPNGVHSTAATTSSAAPLRFGTSAARFTSTPARPSPLRQSMRPDSSSPGSPNSIHRDQDQNTSRISEGAVKTNGAGNHDVAKAGQAKALAIFAEIVSSASQPDSDDKTSTSELVNPYDTRPPTKRARRPAKSARAPPPRPTRRVVSTEVPSPPPPSESPKKPTALETIEKSAPASVQAKRMHAEVNGNLPPEKATSKRPDREEREVIEIDDEAYDEVELQPPSKKAKPEKPKPVIPVEVIDVDIDIDMSEETVSDSTPVVRLSEVIEPVSDSDRTTATQSVLPRPPSPSKSTSSSRMLYPTSLSKGPGRFGTTPKEPSPLRNSFQPDEENATSKREETTSTSVFMPKFAQAESKAVPDFFNTGSTGSAAAETTTTAAVDGVTSSAPSAGLFSKEPKPAESVVPSTSPFEVSSESSLGKTSKPSPFSVFTVPIHEKPVAVTTTTTTGTNGFTFGQSSAATSTFGNKSFSFGASSSKPTFTTATFPKLPSSSSGPAFSSTKTKTDDIEVIKRNVISVKESELPVFSFNVTTTLSGTRDQSACAAALGVPETSLPTFKFDKKVVSSKLAFGTGTEKQSASSAPPPPAAASSLAVPPPKTEAKGFDFTAAGMKAPVSAGWTCSMCFVPNKDTDSKCACCGEDKP